eukprot:g389.t1
MPKSRREKKVSLTKVQSKGRELKMKIAEEIRAACDEYKHLFVFSYENLRSNHFKQLRTQFKASSRFFMGKLSVMRMALGLTKQDEYAEGLSAVTASLEGQVGLLFTNSAIDDVVTFFSMYSKADFARGGCVATRTVEIPEGPIDLFPSLLEQLRQLGLPVKINNGKLELFKNALLCTKDQAMTPEEAKLLKHFNIKMSEFKVNLKCVWTKEGGSFQEI